MSLPTTDFRLVLTTAGSEEQADNLARQLVERRLAACVNIVHQVCSVYRWEGRVTREEEKLLLIKTHASRLEELEKAIRELHTYETPEFVVLPIAGGGADYLDWLSASLG